MSMLNNKILIVFLFICTFSCSNSSDKTTQNEINKTNISTNIIDINLDQKANFKNISTLFDKVNLIVLEGTDESLISDISKLIVYEDMLFVNDTKVSNGIFVFSNKGQFIRKIGHIGNGPGEYSRSNDFTIDVDNKRLYQLDGRQKKINIYELPLGNYIKSIQLDNGALICRFLECSEGRLYTDVDSRIETNNDYMLREIDINTGNNINNWLENDVYNKGYNNRLANNTLFLTGKPFYNSHTYGLKFVQSFMDTILTIDKNGVTPFLSIRSDNLLTKEELQSAWKKDKDANIIANLIQASVPKIYNIHDYFETPNAIFFSYHFGPVGRTAIYQKSNKSVEIINGFLDDLIYKIDLNSNKAGLVPKFLYSDNNGLYGHISIDDIYRLLFLIDNNDLNLKEEQIRELKSLSEDSNPIILHYEYKK